MSIDALISESKFRLWPKPHDPLPFLLDYHLTGDVSDPVTGVSSPARLFDLEISHDAPRYQVASHVAWKISHETLLIYPRKEDSTIFAKLVPAGVSHGSATS
jgi:hypothetical protein